MFFDKVYQSWEEKQIEKYKAMLPLIKKMDLKNALDIGSGKGYFEQFLEKNNINSNITCIDKKEQKHSIKMDAQDLKFESNKFTSIFCIDVLHLIDDTSEMKRVLKENGKILVSIFFNKNNLEKRKSLIQKSFPNFRTIKEIIHQGKENELIRLIEPQQKLPAK